MPSTAKRSPTRKKAAATVPEDWTPSQVVAHDIAARYSDLAPSVNRIMDAGLGEAAALRAITLFQESLGVPGEPMRNPVNAIEAGRLLDTEPA
jgi:hypothetical protein